MRSYITLYKLKFNQSIQYRGAAISGIATQFIWGFLLITLYNLLGSGKMEIGFISTYFWLNQAFIGLLSIWSMDSTMFQEIEDGSIQYRLLKPLNLYAYWFIEGAAHRISNTLLRCIPILTICFFLPSPYKLLLPNTLALFIWFLVSLFFSLLIQLAVGNIMGSISLMAKSSLGVKTLFASLYDVFDGNNIPYVYFPIGLQKILKLTFLYGVRTAPFLIYMGQVDIMGTLINQVVWVILLVYVGYILLNKQIRRIEVYGG